MNDRDLDILKRSLGKYRKVRIKRTNSDEFFANGFVLGLSSSLALVFVFHDFYPEGCRIIRLQDVESVRSGKHERFWDRLLAKEGLLDAVGISSAPPLDDMETLLQHMRDTARPAIVEAEDMNGGGEEEGYFIGRIVRVEGGTCWIHEFDALGNWVEEPSSVAVERITQIHIEAPYMETYLRNIRPFPADLGNGSS